MKTQLSLMTLFASALAGTPAFADGENYDGALLEYSNFSGRSLVDSSWIGAWLIGANFANATLTNANLSYATGRDASFTNAVLAGADCTGADFEGADFSNANLSGADLTDAYFRYANLAGTNLTDAVIAGASFITTLNSSDSALTLEQLYSTKSYKDGNVTDAKFSWVTFTGSAGTPAAASSWARGIDLSGAWTGSRFYGATLDGSANSSNSYAAGIYFDAQGEYSRTSFENASLTGGATASVSEFPSLRAYGIHVAGAWTDASFRGATLDGTADSAPQSGNKAHGLYFDANFSDANFENATLAGTATALDNTVLADASGISFSSFGTWNGANFRNATIAGNAEAEGAGVARGLYVDGTWTNADFEGAALTGTAKNTGWDASGICLNGTWTDANFRNATITGIAEAEGSGIAYGIVFSGTWNGADFENATIAGSASGGRVYNYGIYFSASMTDVSFINANFSGDVRIYSDGYDLDGVRHEFGTKFSGADFRGASGISDEAILSAIHENLILTDGTISNFSLSGENETFRIRAYAPREEGGEVISAKITEAAVADGAGATLRLDAGAALEVLGGASLTFAAGTRLSAGTGAALTVAEGAVLTFGAGSEIAEDAAGTVSFAVAGTLKLEGDRTFSNATSGAGTVEIASGTTTFGTALGVKTLQVNAGASAVFDGVSLSQSETILNGTLNVANVSSISTKLSGSGTLNVFGDTAFSSDASAFAGTVSVERGTLTLAESAILGTGDFAIAGTLRLEGARDFANELSGAGTLATAGEITLSGNAGAFTGTTNISSGTFTIAQNAVLGAGNFEIAGTLKIEGDREFANATSGAGTVEVASGTTTFTRNVGAAALTVAENAEAVFADESGEFSGALSGAGTLTATQDFTLSGDASAFTGAVSVERRTLTVSGSLNAETTLSIFADDSGTASVFVAEGGSVTLGAGAEIVLDFTGTSFGAGSSFEILSWADGAAVSGLDSLEKGSNISLYVNGAAYDSRSWNFEVTDGGLSVFWIDRRLITISTIDQIADLEADDYVATFDEALTRYEGTISGSGTVHSSGTLEFAGDAGALTGATYIDAGTFTIVDEAVLGTGGFVVADGGTLRLEGARDFANELSGAGTLATAGEITLSGNAGEFSGTTRVESGTLTLAQNAVLGAGNFEIAGTLKIEGDRAFANATSGAGTVEVASGTTTFGTALGVKTLQVNAGASAVFDGVSLSQTETILNGTLNVSNVSSIATALSGAGTLNVSGDSVFSSDARAFTGTTRVESGTLTLAESAILGAGNFEIAGTLKIEGARAFANATSGDGAVTLSAGADVSFSKPLGVKTLNVAAGATLRGNVSMTRGADAALILAGTLALNADAGEKVALGGGTVVLAETAELALRGNGSGGAETDGRRFAAATPTIAALENGEVVSIFEDGAVEGDVVAFLGTDAALSACAENFAVVYDLSGGLSVRLQSASEPDFSSVDVSGFSASFVDWARELAGADADCSGFMSAEEYAALGGNDPLLSALRSGNAGAARSILDRLSPKSYAAMIAMPVETFHDDAKSVSARLAQRRFDKFSETGRREFFAQAQMISADNDDARDAPTFDFDRCGVFAGADFRLDESSVVGVALGAGTGEAKIHDGGGKIESDDYRLTGFGGKTFGKRVYVNAGAQLGFASYDVKRRTDYGNADADTDGWNAGVFAEAGVRLAVSETHGVFATPYIGFGYTRAEADSFSESGSEKAAFDADSLSGDSLRARIGCGFSWGFAVAGTAVRLGLDVAYSRELLDDEIDADATAKNGAKISEKAAALPEDVFSIGPTLDVSLTERASVYAGYAFSAGTDSATSHSANVGFRMAF